jgi:hypothetical protein
MEYRTPETQKQARKNDKHLGSQKQGHHSAFAAI